MKEGRLMLNPCEYRSIVYLCGFGSDRMEAFDPVNGVLVPIEARVSEDSESCLFVESDQLVVLSRIHVMRWELNEVGQLRKVKSAVHTKCDLMSNIAPIVDTLSGYIYIVYGGQGYSIKMDGSEGRELDN